MSKFAALSGCTYNDEICFVDIEPKFGVCHPARDITETVTKLFKGKISEAVLYIEICFVVETDHCSLSSQNGAL